MTLLDDLISSASDELQIALSRSRIAFKSHNLSSGESTEAAVREFFWQHYPESVGVGHGQVVDTRGKASSQLDVVLYDKARTPVLFTDKEQENRLFPAEGVIAAVEVKSSLTTEDLRKSSADAKALKNLSRTAYHNSPVAPKGMHKLYGLQWPETAPPLFLVLAFEGPTLETVVKTLRKEQLGTDPWERIDMACVLNRGVTLNTSPNGTYSVEPRRDTLLQGNKMKKSLLFTHVLLSSAVFQMYVPPINLHKYLPENFDFGEMPS